MESTGEAGRRDVLRPPAVPPMSGIGGEMRLMGYAPLQVEP